MRVTRNCDVLRFPIRSERMPLNAVSFIMAVDFMHTKFKLSPDANNFHRALFCTRFNFCLFWI